MRFGPVPLKDALGAILAHSVRVPGGRLRKGLCLQAGHLDSLAAAGISEVTVAQLDAGDMGEDMAATQVAEALCMPGLTTSQATTGRVNLFAEGPGVLDVDRDAVNALNRVDPMITLATLPEWGRVAAGGLAATVKIIAYGVPEDAVARACEAAQGAIHLRPPVVQTASLVQTVSEGGNSDKGRRALAARLERLGVALSGHELVAHKVEDLAQALTDADGEVLFILTSSATSDINDIAPTALRKAGGKLHHYGMPVDPGNLLFIGDLNGRPVIGLPGCARSPALNGADWVMERILCGVEIGVDEIAAMGVGGLLKEMPSRPYPRQG